MATCLTGEQRPFDWHGDWRNTFWRHCQTPLDILVIGGGITGAGVLKAATDRGWRCALIEQQDFAWGSSSRSSKLVHGGLRYLKQGRFGLTRSALKERNALLRDYPDLIQERRFYLPFSDHPALSMRMGLSLYDSLAGRHTRRRISLNQWQQQFPMLDGSSRAGALSYLDAATDDSQLVLRVLQQATEQGAASCNYVRAESLLEHRGKVIGVQACDQISGLQHSIEARLIINATGAWSALRPKNSTPARMRPLRGSHLVIPYHLLPLSDAVACPHPQDQRPVYALPWAGAVLFGTTDVDHADELSREPSISSSEYDYLMSALSRLFPERCIRDADILSSYAGVRPTFDDGASKPSDASREHLLEEADGWLSITGGKLTTFRVMAETTVRQAEQQLRRQSAAPQSLIPRPVTNEAERQQAMESRAHYLLTSNDSEQRWQTALQRQAVQHLDDLLLRRTRVGLTTADGGMKLLLEQQQHICTALGWNAARWQHELTRYNQIRSRHYSAQAFRV